MRVSTTGARTAPRRKLMAISSRFGITADWTSAVTAMYKGTNPKTGQPVLLRSYDSRKEPPPEFNCTIWQAGRATSATGLAFKPIQIGQSVFIDEGSGRYNPSPQVLEEAAINEWPGRDVGVFVSIGTGKRPGGTNGKQNEWWEGFVGGSIGAFAEARRRLIAKIEGCEDTHIQMMNFELAKRGVPMENYCRLNVEVGVGEFGMNEWDRLSDMTIGTRRYLMKPETQELLSNAAIKMAKIELTRRRIERGTSHDREPSFESDLPIRSIAAPHVGAVEMPADEMIQTSHSQQHYRNPSYPPYPDARAATSQDKFMAVPDETYHSAVSSELSYRSSNERFHHRTPISPDDYVPAPSEPPPRPPKTPMNEAPTSSPTPAPQQRSPRSPPNRSNGHIRLPYPDNDGPPPIVSKLRKPEFTAR